MMRLFPRHPCEAHLALFAGGELGPWARWRIEGHLSDCGRCRQAVSEFFELRRRAMDLAELPALDWSGMAAGIERRLAMERDRPKALPLLRPVWAAAALSVLLAAGVYLSLGHGIQQGAVLDASGRGVEWRAGSGSALALTNPPQKEGEVNWISADAASARYLDKETGNVTVTNVYAQ
jgi:anti-sigma factor RsiW